MSFETGLQGGGVSNISTYKFSALNSYSGKR